jgi:hypothetical protein
MISVRIGSVDFPPIALSKMKSVRDRYKDMQENDNNIIDIQVEDIDTPSLVSMRDFMILFPDMELRILLPRTRSVRELINEDVWRWISGIDKNRLNDLHYATYTLGYQVLFDLTSLILSEDINYKSLYSM